MTTTVVVEIAPGRLVFGGTIHARGVQRRDAPGRCVFGGDAVLDDERTAVAIVKWETTTDSNARIDVGVRIRGRHAMGDAASFVLAYGSRGRAMANGRFRHRHDSGETVTHKVTAHRNVRRPSPPTASSGRQSERPAPAASDPTRLASILLGIIDPAWCR